MHIDIDRKPGNALEPVLSDQAGIIGRAAGRSGDAVDLGEIDGRCTRPYRALGEIEIVCQRMRDHFRLFMDFLLHEMPVVALADQKRGARRFLHGAVDDRRRSRHR